jgi:hypothetical protein
MRELKADENVAQVQTSFRLKATLLSSRES